MLLILLAMKLSTVFVTVGASSRVWFTAFELHLSIYSFPGINDFRYVYHLEFLLLSILLFDY